MIVSLNQVSFDHFNNFTLLDSTSSNKIISFKKDQKPHIFSEILKDQLEKQDGINIPKFMQEDFNHSEVIRLNDQRILKAFIKVIYEYSYKNSDLCLVWTTE